MSISDFTNKRQEPEPTEYDAVLGGHSPDISTAAVLGGHGKRLALIFTLFNSHAKACNGCWMRLQIDDQVALVRKRRSAPLDHIKIKILVSYPVWYEGKQLYQQYWAEAGYLKHDGSLFGQSATYDPARCELRLRPIAQHALNKLALELHNKG